MLIRKKIAVKVGKKSGKNSSTQDIKICNLIHHVRKFITCYSMYKCTLYVWRIRTLWTLCFLIIFFIKVLIVMVQERVLLYENCLNDFEFPLFVNFSKNLKWCFFNCKPTFNVFSRLFQQIIALMVNFEILVVLF